MLACGRLVIVELYLLPPLGFGLGKDGEGRLFPLSLPLWVKSHRGGVGYRKRDSPRMAEGFGGAPDREEGVSPNHDCLSRSLSSLSLLPRQERFRVDLVAGRVVVTDSADRFSSPALAAESPPSKSKFEVCLVNGKVVVSERAAPPTAVAAEGEGARPIPSPRGEGQSAGRECPKYEVSVVEGKVKVKESPKRSADLSSEERALERKAALLRGLWGPGSNSSLSGGGGSVGSSDSLETEKEEDDEDEDSSDQSVRNEALNGVEPGKKASAKRASLADKKKGNLVRGELWSLSLGGTLASAVRSKDAVIYQICIFLPKLLSLQEEKPLSL